MLRLCNPPYGLKFAHTWSKWLWIDMAEGPKMYRKCVACGHRRYRKVPKKRENK